MKRTIKGFFWLGAAWLAALPGVAKTGTAPVVAAIEVVGCTRGIQVQALSNIHSRVGVRCTPARLNADIHALARIRGVDDVRVAAVTGADGVTLRYLLHMAPLVTKVTVTTQKKGLDIPAGLVRTRAGHYLNRATLHGDVQRLMAHFRTLNYHGVTVAPQVTRALGDREATVVLVVREGVPQYVERILVRGVNHDDIARVQSFIECAERNRLLFRDGTYDPAVLAADTQKIREYFVGSGYNDAAVTIAAEPGRGRGAVRLVVDVQQGPRYTIAQIAWKPESFARKSGGAMAAAASVKEGDIWHHEVPDILVADTRRFCTENGLTNAAVSVRSSLHESSSPNEPRIKIVLSVRKSGQAPRQATGTSYPFVESFLF